MSDQTLADELENRLIDSAVRVIKLADVLPKTPAGKHIAGQLLDLNTTCRRPRPSEPIFDDK